MAAGFESKWGQGTGGWSRIRIATLEGRISIDGMKGWREAIGEVRTPGRPDERRAKRGREARKRRQEAHVGRGGEGSE